MSKSQELIKCLLPLTEVMDNRVDVTGATATSVTHSLNQIISLCTLALFNTKRGHADFTKGQSHSEQDSPSL